MRRSLTVTALALALGTLGCTTFTYRNTEPGKLSGRLMVMWVAEDRFVYWPSGEDGLHFVPSQDFQARTGVKDIRPGLMYTDGGSIPKPLRSADGFSPWGYAPAYIIHDWLFQVRHCLKNGAPNEQQPEEYRKLAAIDFEDSVRVLAEVMKALMDGGTVKQNPAAFDAISFGVETPIARALWDSDRPGSCTQVSPDHRREVEGALAAEQPTAAPAMMRPMMMPPAETKPSAVGRTGPRAVRVFDVRY